MASERRVIAVVSTPVLSTAVRDACAAEPEHYRARLLPLRCMSLSHWELMVNYAQGDLLGAASTGTLIRTLRAVTAARIVDLDVVREPEGADEERLFASER